ncbi:zinc ribbon domain-containing protein [Thermopolyspora sp. NPDC052614]|uniref:FmdB family zinc ribbon protein n=1 Tax=Thermopolyspora sp. NPDC052614 TaxID=3155682 RepID=UPI00342A37D1
MPIYDLRCAGGHRFEVIQSFTAPLPACPQCGADTTKIPSRFGIGGRASVPPPPEAMPQTWRGTYHADREYVAELRRTVDERRRLEERHPELAGDRRPILAHEGRYEGAPLRAGDPLPGGSAADRAASGGPAESSSASGGSGAGGRMSGRSASGGSGAGGRMSGRTTAGGSAVDALGASGSASAPGDAGADRPTGTGYRLGEVRHGGEGTS